MFLCQSGNLFLALCEILFRNHTHRRCQHFALITNGKPCPGIAKVYAHNNHKMFSSLTTAALYR